MHVIGCLIHGFGLLLAASEPDLAKDSNCQIEIIALALNRLYGRCGVLPLHLHIQADNTCREGKNQYVFIFAAVLVQLHVFKTVSLCFLRKGQLTHML